MKRKFRSIAILLIIALTAGIQVFAEEVSKEYHESWSAADVQKLEISNKFGEVKVKNNESGEVTIDVIITVEAPNQSKANELLGQLNVSIKKSGKIVKAETLIDSDFKSRDDFSIDYDISVPSDKDLDIYNKYGNTIVNVLNANGKFDIKYGNFTANELNTPAGGSMLANIEYGKGDISLSNSLTVTARYSTINFDESGDIVMDSKYTVVNIGTAESVKAEAKYDTFNFDEVGALSADTKYCSIKIDKLFESLKLDAAYGGLRVGEVDPGFSLIEVTNSYGGISVGLGDNSYSVEADCDHCGISYPGDDFEGDYKKDGRNARLEGKVGTGEGGNVIIKSRYGQIKLN